MENNTEVPSTSKQKGAHIVQLQEEIANLSESKIETMSISNLHSSNYLDDTKRKKRRIAPREKRSKLWNYFEKLKPLLVVCIKCKKEIHIPNSSRATRIFRVHLRGHGIFIKNDTFTLPDDLRQYYSELQGYKARCNDCGQILYFLNDKKRLRLHLIKHSIKIQRWDKAVTMASNRKRSKLWDYFEEVEPWLVKCKKCKKEIQVLEPTALTQIFRSHLNGHGIFPDNDIHTLPDDLRQYYSKLPGYKARCNDCGKTVSFLDSYGQLRKHLRRHSTKIQSRDKAITMAPIGKRSKLWNYFEELKPSLVKCRKCKKEIQIPHPTRLTRIFRGHLNGHGIFPNNDTHTLPDDLRQYYSELPGYEAKCNNCEKTLSFLRDYASLRKHLRTHSARIQSRDETFKMASRKERSKLWDYFEKLKSLLVKCKKCTKEIQIPVKTSAIRIFRAHLNGHRIYFSKMTLAHCLTT